MSERALLLQVSLLGDRWHGAGDWPPSPFRLFQALVAGAYGGRWAAEDPAEKDAAFRWLEALPPPRIAAPPRTPVRPLTTFVPNNDLDAVDSDPRRVGEVRTAKTWGGGMLERGGAFLYVWDFQEGEAQAERFGRFAERLHTLGRGVDAAFASVDIVDAGTVQARLQAHGGAIFHPRGRDPKRLAPCPTEGSLDSLKARHVAARQGVQIRKEGRKRSVLFRRPPLTPQSRQVAYDSPPVRELYDLRRPNDLRRFQWVSQVRARRLVETIRDAAHARLVGALPDQTALLDRFLIGRGAEGGDVERRVRLIPLPSIGGPHVSPAIRRLVVEIPSDCPLSARDLSWALSGLEVADGATGEIVAALVPASDWGMTRHYGFGKLPDTDKSWRRWRSVTPVALPHPPGRARTGGERAAAEAQAQGALAAALRHAGIEARVASLTLQREPFHSRGVPAAAFDDDRFAGRLRHVEVEFDRPTRGPLVIGDGRFLGLGLMQPIRTPPSGLHLFAIAHPVAGGAGAAAGLAHALRRAVMARAQAAVGARTPLPAFFTGHEPDGAPLRSGRHQHLFFLADDADGDGALDRLAVIAPHWADRKVGSADDRLEELERALESLDTLRAGRHGVLSLTPLGPPAEDDPVFGRSRVWVSGTPYRPTRHPVRKATVEAALCKDILTECDRRGLPKPKVEILEHYAGPRGGLFARARLEFVSAVAGPILLGVGSHEGDGEFIVR